MAKPARTLDLALGPRLSKLSLTRWLYEELRRAILERKLPPGTRLPPTRDLAAQFRVSRGVVVTAFDQLRAEGYLTARVGGSRVRIFAGKQFSASESGAAHPESARCHSGALQVAPSSPIQSV